MSGIRLRNEGNAGKNKSHRITHMEIGAYARL